jgi:hypothetical protein
LAIPAAMMAPTAPSFAHAAINAPIVMAVLPECRRGA